MQQSKFKNKNKLSTQHFLKLIQIFEEKKWIIENTEDEKESLFNRYCNRLLHLGNNKQRDLILDLTKRYIWINYNDYINYLIDALIKLFDDFKDINCCDKIYVMQLISPNDIGKIKSSSMLVYLFNDVMLRYNTLLSKKKFVIINDIEKLPKEFESENAILLLADDYIGTGETAEKCLLSLFEYGINANRLCIIGLVAQQIGIDLIKKYQIRISSSIIINRGISDYYIGDELKINTEIMQSIENRLSVKEKFKFGYKKSEALVTMCRTPNNTFPIFWEENNNNKLAPFPRW